MRTTRDEEEEMEEEWVVALFPRHHPVHFFNDRTQVKVSGREQQPRLSPRLGWRERVRRCLSPSSKLLSSLFPSIEATLLSIVLLLMNEASPKRLLLLLMLL